mgnify:CR=1 FL=1
MLCEVDDNFMNDPKNVDIRFFFRKLLLCYEKKMSTSMKECVSLVLDYTFDPNNTYLQQDFLHFSLVEQLILLQDILCRQKILDYHTMYYEQNCCSFIEQYTKIFLNILSRRNNNQNFHKRIEERNVIGYFLELYAVLTGKEKYNEYKKQLEVYTEDLNYIERLKIINTQLDMIINNEAPKYTFITTVENIKETAFEINYLIESICQLDENTQSTEPYLIYLYETFSKELREITVKSLKCIKTITTK